MEEGIDIDKHQEQKEVVNSKEVVIKQEVLDKLKEETKRGDIDLNYLKEIQKNFQLQNFPIL